MRGAEESRNILAIDDKFEEDVHGLIEVGKEKGYLTYGDVNDALPDEIGSPDDLDDLITTIGTQGIDLLDTPKFPGDKEFELEEGEDVELDLTPGTLEKTNDPVRMYLREMGTVPLLTREGEVEIAKRIERGQMRVLKAISRSPIVIREIAALGEDLKRGVRNVKEVVIFDEEELTEEVVQARVKATVARTDALVKHQKKIAQLEEKQAAIPAGSKAKVKEARRLRWAVGREKVFISRIVRELKYTPMERKRLLDKVNKTVDTMRTLERQIRSLEQKFEASKSEELKKEYRRQQKNCRTDLEKIEGDAGVVDCGAEAHAARDDPGRHGRRAGQARADRGQPAAGGVDRQEVHQPRTAVPRPDSGRQHRPDEGGGQVRIPARLQVLDVCDVVDSAGDYARHCRPGADDPHSGAHDRDHQQAHPHQPPAWCRSWAASRRAKRLRGAWTFLWPRCARC